MSVPLARRLAGPSFSLNVRYDQAWMTKRREQARQELKIGECKCDFVSEYEVFDVAEGEILVSKQARMTLDSTSVLVGVVSTAVALSVGYLLGKGKRGRRGAGVLRFTIRPPPPLCQPLLLFSISSFENIFISPGGASPSLEPPDCEEVFRPKRSRRRQISLKS